MEDNGVFISHPRNGANIMRFQTTNLRAWEVPRTNHALSLLQSELVQDRYPSIYILFEGNRRVYVGETETIIGRLRSHYDGPQQNITHWDKAFVINDGRSARFSDFNDTAVRHNLEYYTKLLFQYNGYQVISNAREQPITAYQNTCFNLIKSELNLLLFRCNLIERLLDRPEEREIFSDELRSILEEHGKHIQEWGEYEAQIDGVKHFIRPGSHKTKGWQITSRGRKRGSFIDSLIRGQGNLLVRRGKILIIPLQLIKVITDIEQDSDRDTIDIFITFNDGQMFLKYHDQVINVTEYKLIN